MSNVERPHTLHLNSLVERAIVDIWLIYGLLVFVYML